MTKHYLQHRPLSLRVPRDLGAVVALVALVLLCLPRNAAAQLEEEGSPTTQPTPTTPEQPVTTPPEEPAAPEPATAPGEEEVVIPPEAVTPAVTPLEPTPSPEDQDIVIDLTRYLAPRVAIGAKEERPLEQTPSIVTVFSRKEIDELGARTLLDLLHFVPGFYEVAAQLDRNFAIRGVHAASAQHFVVMVDGVWTNDFLTSTASPDAYNLDYADRVEIIRGPGSAVYGANALMGVVNIITKNGKDHAGFKEALSVGSTAYFHNSLSQGIDFGDKGDLFVSGSVWANRGYRFRLPASEDILTPSRGQNISDGIQAGENLTLPRESALVRPDSYELNYDVLAKYRYKDAAVLRFGAARNAYRMQRSYRQALLDDEEDQRPTNITDRVFFDVEGRLGDADKYGKLTLRNALFFFNHDMRSQRISRSFYGQATAQEQSVIFAFAGKDLRINPSLEYDKTIPDFSIFNENRVVVGVQGEYNVAYDYGMNRCFRETSTVGFDQASAYGPEFYCLRQQMFDEDLAIGSLGTITDEDGNATTRFDADHPGNGDEFRVGAFVQYSSYFLDNYGLVVGARVDAHSDFGAQVSPRIALMAYYSRVYFKAQFSSAFAYPAFLYRTQRNELSHFLGNPEIDPQSIRAYEVLFGLKGGQYRIELNAYFNQVRDFITFDPNTLFNTGKYLFGNAGDLDIFGTEANARVVFWDGRIRLSLGASFAKPLSSSDDQFVVDGWLGGPSKFPKFALAFTGRIEPIRNLVFSTGTLYSTAIDTTIADPVTFQDLQSYPNNTVVSSKGPGDYETQTVQVSLVGSYRIFDHWKIAAELRNLLARKQHKPGAVLVPYLHPGFSFIGTASFEY